MTQADEAKRSARASLMVLESREDDDNRCSMREITPEGVIYSYEFSGHPYILEDEYFAIGSGRDFALAAMDCGKTAEESIAVAMKFDIYTGRGIDILQLNKDMFLEIPF